jgi:chromosome partitioning protein
MAVVIGLVSQKGGVGKSTLARALGAVVAHGGLKVRIADLDPRQQTVVEWERMRGENRLAPLFDVRGFATVAQALAGMANDELLILDAPAHTGRRTLDIVKAADLVIQPTSGSLDDLRPAVMFFHDLVQAGIPMERLALALSRILVPGEEEAARAYLTKAGYEVLAGAIPERAAYREAHNRGQAVTEGKRRADDQVDRLIEALVEKVHALMLAKSRRAKAAVRTKETKS